MFPAKRASNTAPGRTGLRTLAALGPVLARTRALRLITAPGSGYAGTPDTAVTITRERNHLSVGRVKEGTTGELCNHSSLSRRRSLNPRHTKTGRIRTLTKITGCISRAGGLGHSPRPNTLPSRASQRPDPSTRHRPAHRLPMGCRHQGNQQTRRRTQTRRRRLPQNLNKAALAKAPQHLATTRHGTTQRARNRRRGTTTTSRHRPPDQADTPVRPALKNHQKKSQPIGRRSPTCHASQQPSTGQVTPPPRSEEHLTQPQQRRQLRPGQRERVTSVPRGMGLPGRNHRAAQAEGLPGLVDNDLRLDQPELPQLRKHHVIHRRLRHANPAAQLASLNQDIACVVCRLRNQDDCRSPDSVGCLLQRRVAQQVADGGGESEMGPRAEKQRRYAMFAGGSG
nr:hypothetical protein KPHV_87420 [Kitasatospora purpeofusca]